MQYCNDYDHNAALASSLTGMPSTSQSPTIVLIIAKGNVYGGLVWGRRGEGGTTKKEEEKSVMTVSNRPCHSMINHAKIYAGFFQPFVRTFRLVML